MWPKVCELLKVIQISLKNIKINCLTSDGAKWRKWQNCETTRKATIYIFNVFYCLCLQSVLGNEPVHCHIHNNKSCDSNDEHKWQTEWQSKRRTKVKHHKIPTIVSWLSKWRSCWILRLPFQTIAYDWNHWTKLPKHDYGLRNHFDIQIFEFHGEKFLVVCQSCDISMRLTKEKKARHKETNRNQLI